MSDIIKNFETKIKFTDHVFMLAEGKDGNPTVRTNPNTKMPKGIYQIFLEGTETKPGFGVLYLGISGAEKQTAREGTKQRWHAHGQKMTGIFKNAKDTENFAQFRKDVIALGYDLNTILDRIYVRFIPLKGKNKSDIDAMETTMMMGLLAKGQCRLNSAKRKPALSKHEFDYFINQTYLTDES